MARNKWMVLVVFPSKSEISLAELALQENFQLIPATNGTEAEDLAIRYHPDAAVINSTLEDMTGLELMQKFRERQDFPVVLVGNLSDREKVTALQNGVDYIIEKPYYLPELEEAINNRLARRTSPKKPVVLLGHDIKIDTANRVVTKGGSLLRLSRTEWRLLECLVNHPNVIMLSSEILTKVWGADYQDDLQYLRVWISRLRSKLEEDPQKPKLITTHPGMGYMFSVIPE